MGKIQTIKDGSENIYPRTSASAVSLNDGTTAEEKFASTDQELVQISQNLGEFTGESHAAVCKSIESIESEIGDVETILATING